MSYDRIEINLLPPELQPGPAVRYGLMVNIAMIAGTVTFIVLDAIINSFKLNDLVAQNKNLEQTKVNLETVTADFNRLIAIDQQITNYGKMISLASGFYYDLPVVMDRISRLLPAEVYVDKVSNARTRKGSKSSQVSVALKTSRRDPRLMQQTLVAFKGEPLFQDCFLRTATFEQESLDPIKQRMNVDWSASGAEIDEQLLVDMYTFEIAVNLPLSARITGLPVAYDQSRYFEGYDIDLSAVDEEAEGRQNVAKGAKAVKSGTSAPEGVKPVEVH
jgi:hypothetical protein